jgi:hypothetical protein
MNAKYSIPPDLTPDVLFGETTDKRNKKATLILNIINKSMADLKQIALENSKLMKTNPAAKDTAERAMKMFKELDATKKRVTAIIQNAWQPLPNISTPKEIFINAA